MQIIARWSDGTLSGFERAWRFGHRAVSFALQETRDGKLVIYDDPDISRLFNGQTIPIANLSIDELYYLVNSLRESPSERFPLEFEWWIFGRQFPHGSFVNIEINSMGAVRQIYALLRRRRRRQELFCISSPYPEYLKLFSDFPEVQLALLVETSKELEGVLPRVREQFGGVHVPAGILSDANQTVLKGEKISVRAFIETSSQKERPLNCEQVSGLIVRTPNPERYH